MCVFDDLKENQHEWSEENKDNCLFFFLIFEV